MGLTVPYTGRLVERLLVCSKSESAVDKTDMEPLMLD